jgi:hypothetical protein
MPETRLTELERRTLGNLSIPRNADDLAGHVHPRDPHAVSAADVDALLRGVLSDAGWVTKLGTHDDPAKLASKVQGHRQAMELPDEKAEIFSRRMLRPDLNWRMSGDLWMLTNEGLAELHKPVDEKPPMTPSEVQAAVDNEWSRVLRKPFVEGKTSLVNALLEDEFARWFKQVADDAEARWNVRPKAPMGGGASGWSDAYEVTIIDAENQKTATPANVDPWFMALSILAFTDADTGTTADNGSHIPTYTGYARKSVAGTDMPAATSGAGSAANTSAIIFAACTAGTSTILAVANCKAATVDILRKWGDCASTVISTTQTPPQFAIGAYVTTAA